MLGFVVLPVQGGNVKKTLSPCCKAKIDASLGDGVLIGSCSSCHKPVCRLNPQTRQQEWLDGESPWTTKKLRRIAA